MSTPWEAGNSETRLATELIDYMDTWIRDVKYSSRLPNQHIVFDRPGDKQSSGLQIILMIERDMSGSFSYINADGDPVLVEKQSIGIAVRADRRTIGLKGVEAVMGILKSIFGAPAPTEEREDLISRGICDLYESVGGLELDPGGQDDEALVISQTLSLTCETEILIN